MSRPISAADSKVLPYILDVWRTCKFYGYRRIAAYSQQTDGPKVSEYMTLN